MIRAFFAIDLPLEFREEIARLQGLLKRSRAEVKWVRPESVHLTLKFLGQVAEETIDPLAAKAAKKVSRIPAVTLGLSGAGVFPGPKRPRVAWVGLAGDMAVMGDLQKGIEEAAAEFGFEREKRKFSPHLTLGRIRPSKRIGELMSELDRIDPKPLEFLAREVILFKSDLKPTGAVYTPLKTLPLRGVPTEESS
ncbi:MAG: RNA 2',3'-cyclic phosphodiesterase [Deltaproteobacteria bacterium]|nr:RNA 2',3'-cyclic phosphodiesterase [Deltaproteobacteria bacterium]